MLTGSFGYLAFDIAPLWACFRAVGHFPSLGVLVVAYMIGQIGGLLPIPIGGIEGGLIGMFAVFHVPLASGTVAVLAYRGLALWIPGLLGSLAFVQLRRALAREEEPPPCVNRWPSRSNFRGRLTPLVARRVRRPAT